MELITAHGRYFLCHGIEELLLAKMVYLHNEVREPIAPGENQHSIASILAFWVWFKGNLNRIAYLEQTCGSFDGYNAMSPMDEKCKAIFNRCARTFEFQNFVEGLAEFRLQRNSIVHGHVYKEIRTVDGEFSVVAREFHRVNGISPRAREEVVDFRTVRHKLTVIPTEVSFIDCLRAYLAVAQFARVAMEIWPMSGGIDARAYIMPITLLKSTVQPRAWKYLSDLAFDGTRLDSVADWRRVALHDVRRADMARIQNFERAISIGRPCTT